MTVPATPIEERRVKDLESALEALTRERDMVARELMQRRAPRRRKPVPAQG